jgi:hypothetical protein
MSFANRVHSQKIWMVLNGVFNCTQCNFGTAVVGKVANLKASLCACSLNLVFKAISPFLIRSLMVS